MASWLFITGDGTLNLNGDQSLRDLIVLQGDTVTVESDLATRTQSTDEATYDVIWISSSVNSTNIDNNVGNYAIPIGAGEAGFADELGFGATTADAPTYADVNLVSDLSTALGTFVTGEGFSASQTVTVWSAQETVQAVGNREFGYEVGIANGAAAPAIGGMDEGDVNGLASSPANADRAFSTWNGGEVTSAWTTDGESLLLAVIGYLKRSLSSPPNQPTIVSPTNSSSVTTPVSIEITYSDPDGDAQAKVSIRRPTP